MVRKVLPTNNFYISMHDPINNRILFPYCVSETNLVEGQRPVAKGLTEYLLRQEKVIFLTPADLVRLIENGEVSSDMAPRMSWLGAPLSDALGRTCGAMAIYWPLEKQEVQENYIRLLEIIAAQVSVAIIRVRAEEALKESEALFTMGPAVKLIIDPHDGNIVNANGVALDFYGYSAHELRAMNISDINVDPAKDATENPTKTMRDGSERPNLQHRIKDGSLKDVEVYSGPITIGGKTLLQSTIIDVSSRTKMERELQKSSERLELVIEASGAGIWDWNMKSGAMFLDRQWKSIIGYAEHEFEDKFSEWSDRIHPEDSRRMLQAVTEAQKDKTGKYEVEYRLRHKDGSYRWVKTVGKITYDAQGEPERLTGSNIDITENRKLMALHLENENRLKDFAQAVPDVSFVIDEAGKVIEAFGSDETMFPAPKTHIQGHTISEVFSGEMAKNLMEDIKRTIEKKSTLRVEYVADVAKGQLFLVGRLSPMRFILEGKNLVAAVFQDFTERWKAESMLQASYQMRRKSDFLNDLILGSRALDKETMEFAAKIGLDFSRPLFCCIVSCEQSSVSGNKSNGSIFDVPARKDEIMEAIDDGTNRIIWDCRDVIGVIYLLEELDTVDRKCCIKAAEFLKANISENNPGIDVMIGIGDVGLGGDGLRNSFQQAWSTMTAIRSRAGKTGSVSHYRDLGILQLLARKIDNESAEDFIRVTIGKILDYDRDKGTEYLQTLEVILSHESLKESAQLLFVHPNTVLYRRQRIEKLLNISLDDIEVKVAVIAAMKLYKLNH
ncbi:MAG: domain S-box [Firmicutes bacterium]|nr:domain S-box [Bacillota bacterium]